MVDINIADVDDVENIIKKIYLTVVNLFAIIENYLKLVIKSSDKFPLKGMFRIQ